MVGRGSPAPLSSSSLPPSCAVSWEDMGKKGETLPRNGRDEATSAPLPPPPAAHDCALSRFGRRRPRGGESGRRRLEVEAVGEKEEEEEAGGAGGRSFGDCAKRQGGEGRDYELEEGEKGRSKVDEIRIFESGERRRRKKARAVYVARPPSPLFHPSLFPPSLSIFGMCIEPAETMGFKEEKTRRRKERGRGRRNIPCMHKKFSISKGGLPRRKWRRKGGV